MPEVYFRVLWPDQSESRCYSPSSTIKEFLVAGHSYTLSEFTALSRQALEHASERVRQKYGYGCGHASSQIAMIEARAAHFSSMQDPRVSVIAFES